MMSDLNDGVRTLHTGKHPEISEGIFSNPVYLHLTVMISIFPGETIIMIVLSRIRDASLFESALLDALMLIIISFPIIYFFFLQADARLHA